MIRHSSEAFALVFENKMTINYPLPSFLPFQPPPLPTELSLNDTTALAKNTPPPSPSLPPPTLLW